MPINYPRTRKSNSPKLDALIQWYNTLSDYYKKQTTGLLFEKYVSEIADINQFAFHSFNLQLKKLRTT